MKYRGDEKKLMHKILMAFSKGGCKLFRNNVGLFTTKDGRKVMTGLCKGSSDLIGWKTVTITPDMAGKDVAIFTAIEVKGGKGAASKQQIHFVESVLDAGGIAGVVNSLEKAEEILG